MGEPPSIPGALRKTIDEIRREYRKANNLDPIPAILGDENGVIYDDPATWGASRVRVRIKDTRGFLAATVVPNEATSLVMSVGAPVWLGFNESGELVLQRARREAQVRAGFNYGANNAADALAHAFLEKSQWAELLCTPMTTPLTDSLSVWVRSWIYLDSNGQWQHWSGGGIDLSGYVPAANRHLVVVVYLATDVTLGAAASTAQSTSIPLDITDMQEATDAMPTNATPVWFWKLTGGQTKITASDTFLDARQFINIQACCGASATGSSGVSTSYYDEFQDDGIGFTQRNAANFVDSSDIFFTLSDNAGNDSTDITAALTVTGVGASTYSCPTITVDSKGRITAALDGDCGGAGVTSVGLSLPGSVFSVTGSPVTGAGTLTGAFVSQPINTVFAGPAAGGAASPTFRALVSADLPSISHSGLADLDADDHTQYLLADGTRGLTGDWDAGSQKITAEQLESDVATGTAPLVIASETLVDNLNADLLDGQEGTFYNDLANATGVLALEHGGTESDLSATGPGYVHQASAGAALTILKHNLAAGAAPTVNDDTTAGYAIGSLWIDTTNDNAYVCMDASAGAAVWEQIDGGGAASPLTTKGDLWGYDTDDTRVPVGSDDLPLVADSGDAQGVTYKILPLEGGGTESNLSATGPGMLQQASAGAAVSALKHNLTAVAAPTINDDTTAGYAVGSMWVNTSTDQVYFCADAGSGAAVWRQIGGSTTDDSARYLAWRGSIF